MKNLDLLYYCFQSLKIVVKLRINLVPLQVLSYRNLGGKGGICLNNVDTELAKSRPQSAITVSVNGIPTRAKTIQKALPSVVIGTIFP